jgi:hypothetical protein
VGGYSKSKPLFTIFETYYGLQFVGTAESRDDAVHNVERVRRQFGDRARFVIVGGKQLYVPPPGEES